jgi:lysophospholipase L1-like esterase
VRARLTAIPRFDSSPRPTATARANAAAVPATTPSPPFRECPAIGADTSCGILIYVTNSGATVLSDPSQGPYDGGDDTLVGVLNASGKAITSLSLSSSADIFGFDGDGICTYSGWPAQSGCPYGPTGYEGPGTQLDGNGSNTGSVVFNDTLAPGASAYFGLENALTNADLANPKGYVALGDSYSSGQGSESALAQNYWYSNPVKPCLRGPGGWPIILGKDSGGSLVIKGSGKETSFFACAGATSGEILNGGPKRPKQVHELEEYRQKNGTPGLVTLTAGGNDVHFAELLETCYSGGIAQLGQCEDVLVAEIAYLTRWHKSFSNKLATLYSKVASVAGTGSKIEVVGYPKIMPPWTSVLSASLRCSWIDLKPAVLVLANEVVEDLNNDIRQAASQAHVGYASVEDAVAGRTLCTGDPWIGELTLYNGKVAEIAGHPRPPGQSALASTVLNDMRSAGLPFVAKKSVHTAHTARQAAPLAKAPRVAAQAQEPLSANGSAVPANATVGYPYVGYLTVAGGEEPYSWTVTGGSLPEGLTLDPETGVISGQTTAAGHSTFTVTASDSTEPTPAKSSVSVTISSNAPEVLDVATKSLPIATAGRPYETTLKSGGGTNPITWSIEAGSLPSGLTLDGETGIISGTPTAPGTSAITVRATDSTEPTAQTATAKLQLVIDAEDEPFAIATSELGTASQGAFYSEPLTATGGAGPAEWSVSSGTLPAGLTLEGSSGTISGVATESGTFPLTITAQDRATPSPHTANTHFTLRVVAASMPTILANDLPNGEQGGGYYATLNATGGVAGYTWDLSGGALPPGISLDASSGTIEGIPTESGTFTFTATVSDGSTPSPQSVSETYTLTVAASPPVLQLAPPEATVNIPYAYTPSVSGGVEPYTWSIASGGLPAGLSLEPSTGAISGTPTTTGSVSVTLRVADSSLPASQSVTAHASLVVGAAPPLQIETTALPAATSEEPYRALVFASGGTRPLSFSITHGSLPSGLSLDAETGVISGTPSSQATSEFTLQVADSSQPSQVRTAVLSITVNAPPALTIATSELSNATAGDSYSQTLIATGGTRPYKWSLSSGVLPPGLTLSEATGQLAGTLTEPGQFAFTVKVTDSATTPKTASVPLTITIQPASSLTLTTTSISPGEQGAYYDGSLEAQGGVAPYTWSIAAGALPEGLSLDPSSGAIYGDPTSYGTYSFTVQVDDSSSPSPEASARKLSIKIAPAPPLSVSATSLAAGTQGQYYEQPLGVSGGVAPYSVTVSSGALPEGLSIDAYGDVYGEITSAQSEPFTLSISDGATPHAQTVTRHYTIEVTAAPPLELASKLGSFVQGQYAEQAVGVTGGVPGYTWTVDSSKLPTGLTFSDGYIYGTPTKKGKGTLTVTAADSATPAGHSATTTLTVTVTKPPKLKITTKKLPNAAHGTYYQQAIAVTGGTSPDTLSISAGALPPGMSQSGEWIYGTPETTGTYSFTIKVTDSASPKPQTTTKSFKLSVI